MARMKERVKYLDAIRGSMIGGAVGDALGYPVEFLSYLDIQSVYGNSGIRSYVYDSSKDRALISDDTQMTLFTAVGILNGDTRVRLRGIGGPPSSYIWDSYQAWLRTQRGISGSPDDKTKTWLDNVPELYAERAPGITCLSALSGGIPGRIENPINNSKGCGGVMRVAPLGLYYSSVNLSDLDREGAAVAALTHGHPLGYMPAAVLTHIINQITYARDRYACLREIVLSSRNAVAALFSGNEYTSALTELINLAVTLSENGRPDLENIRRLGEGWVAEETLAIAIYCSLRYSDDFSEGIIAAVNHDGDSDSTGAVTGNILGAWLGYSAIPEKWKNKLELSEVILEVADDLCHGCQMEEYSTYRDPEWEAKYISRDYIPDISDERKRMPE